MTPEALRLYSETLTAYQQLLPQANAMAQQINRAGTAEECADLALVAKKSEELIDELRKALYRVKELAIKKACTIWAVTSTDGEPIRTEYTTATPDVAEAVAFPKRDEHPDKYAALMAYMGIDPGLWKDCQYPAVDFHYNGMIDLIAGCRQRGQQFPPGLDESKVYTTYKLRLATQGKKKLPTSLEGVGQLR